MWCEMKVTGFRCGVRNAIVNVILLTGEFGFDLALASLEHNVYEVGTHCAFAPRLARYFDTTYRNMESKHKTYRKRQVRAV